MFVLTNHLIEYTIGPVVLLQHYVYEWWKDTSCIYVGAGTNRRAWNTHNEEVEKLRVYPFKVVIIQHNLTKSMAHAEERFRIHLRRRQGHNLIQRNS